MDAAATRTHKPRPQRLGKPQSRFSTSAHRLFFCIFLKFKSQNRQYVPPSVVMCTILPARKAVMPSSTSKGPHFPRRFCPRDLPLDSNQGQREPRRSGCPNMMSAASCHVMGFTPTVGSRYGWNSKTQAVPAARRDADIGVASRTRRDVEHRPLRR